MKRRTAMLLLLCLPLGAYAGAKTNKKTGGTALDSDTASKGIKQALEKSTQQAVSQLGRENGYFGNPRVKIPLPDNLTNVEKTLRKFGQGKTADEFILSLNRAAEAAAPEAKAIFLKAIRKMSVQDAVGIVNGPDDAATRYFRKHTESSLRSKFRPIVAASTDKVGVTQSYKKFTKEAGPASSLIDTRSLDLDDYVTDKALDGLFLMVADEEKLIREDPVARTTDLLREVFGL
jgi:hypothetical protein